MTAECDEAVRIASGNGTAPSGVMGPVARLIASFLA
jgi:hypothetical protein